MLTPARGFEEANQVGQLRLAQRRIAVRFATKISKAAGRDSPPATSLPSLAPTSPFHHGGPFGRQNWLTLKEVARWIAGISRPTILKRIGATRFASGISVTLFEGGAAAGR